MDVHNTNLMTTIHIYLILIPILIFVWHFAAAQNAKLAFILLISLEDNF